jgi:iron complex outermembrane receptor protein
MSGARASLAARAALASVGVALAADASAGANSDLEDVVVTARRRVEPLAAVPRAVTVVPGASLGSDAIDGLQALATRVPGLAFESLWGGGGSAPVLRGQSQPSTAGDNVGVFVDGVYQANRSLVDVEPLDVARVEVVEGPQNALFGRSTFAGAIHFVSRAPTPSLQYGARGDRGSDGLWSATGWVSGPVAGTSWRARLAASRRDLGGTIDDAVDGHALGGWRTDAAVVTLARPSSSESSWSATLRSRWFRREETHPAVATLGGASYDCGSRDATSGQWSYFCGRPDPRAAVTISPGVPVSTARAVQTGIELSIQLAGLALDAAAAFYDGEATAFRDFDAGRAAFVLGVCRAGRSCSSASGAPGAVERQVAIDVVARTDSAVTEWSQDLRLRSADASRVRWTVGAYAAQSRTRAATAFGADGRGLANDEIVTALIPTAPLRLGPISLLNRALVADPDAVQRVQSQDVTDRRNLAIYGSVEASLAPWATARVEVRASRDRERLDARVAGFVPGVGRALPVVRFDSVTPRVELAIVPAAQWNAWTSAAKGARSGGVNPVPGLDPGEQGYAPESNWTYEVGARWRSQGRRAAIDGVAYYVDWEDTQTLGLATTPGIRNLITRNTAGITTRGLEVSGRFEPVDSVRLSLAYALADPRFRAGSDDAGARAFCGITATNTRSTFCTAGPSRVGGDAGIVVPYLDGNVPGRAVRRSWAAAIDATLATSPSGWRLELGADAGMQDDAFERGIDGLRYGRRTLVDARATLSRGPWSLSLWGRNLTDERYVRAAASRAAVYYPTSPRPIDLLQGDRRRVGISILYEPTAER